jgi:enoyl-CoA hydratase/carnithine racemase
MERPEVAQETGAGGGRLSIESRDFIAVIRIDNPPVNALDALLRAELERTLDRLSTESGTDALVITGTGRTFVAGADINELAAAIEDHSREPPDFHRLLAAIEDFPKPIVMAIGGAALGGGLELAMAGHYRIALAGAPGAARGEPRHRSRRRGHAAPAAPGGRREGARDVRVGPAHRGLRRARCRPGGRGRRAGL